MKCRADSRLAPSQWETSLQSNAVSHWLGANLESALKCMAPVPWEKQQTQITRWCWRGYQHWLVRPFTAELVTRPVKCQQMFPHGSRVRMALFYVICRMTSLGETLLTWSGMIHRKRTQGPFSICGRATSQSMRKDVIFVTSFLIGWDLAQQ